MGGCAEVLNRQIAQNPLKGQNEPAYLARYSFDSVRVTSISTDKTVYVWSGQNVLMIEGPLEKYTGAVNSVAFSSNCMRIVSGGRPSSIPWCHIGRWVKILETSYSELLALWGTENICNDQSYLPYPLASGCFYQGEVGGGRYVVLLRQ